MEMRRLSALRGPALGRAVMATWAVIVLLWVPLPAVAAERSVSDVVLVDSGAVIDDDLYAAGNRVVILGRVDGDLIVSAFEDVTIAGEVRGDVIGVAGSVVVTGSVGESVRVAAPIVDIHGDVGGDAIVVAWEAAVGGVAGDAIIWGWEATVDGEIGGDLEGQTRRMSLAGTVEGNVDITVDRLEVVGGARVGSDLAYRSSRPAVGVEEAQVGGAVVHRSPLAPNIRVRALMVLAKVVIGLLAGVVGLLLMWGLPDASRRAVTVVRTSPWRAWVAGFLVLLTPLFAAALAALLLSLAPPAATLPLIGVFVPVMLAILGVILALVFAAPAAVYPWLGRLGREGRGEVRAFLYGAALVTVVALVPWLVWIVLAVVAPIGVGGWIGPTSPEPTTDHR